jgi:hypothetical protein
VPILDADGALGVDLAAVVVDEGEDVAVGLGVAVDFVDLEAVLGRGEAFEDGRGDGAGGLDLVDMAATW